MLIAYSADIFLKAERIWSHKPCHLFCVILDKLFNFFQPRYFYQLKWVNNNTHQ